MYSYTSTMDFQNADEQIENFIKIARDNEWNANLKAINNRFSTANFRHYQLDVMNAIQTALLDDTVQDIMVTIPTGSGKNPLIGSVQIYNMIDKCAHICHYIAINKSNLEFIYHPNGKEKITSTYGCVDTHELKALKLDRSENLGLDISGNQAIITPRMLFAGIYFNNLFCFCSLITFN